MSFFTKLFDAPTMAAGATSAASGTRTAAARTLEHTRALTTLFLVEVAEYISFQRRRGTYIVLAAVALLVSYLLGCALSVSLLLPFVGWAGALAIVMGVNLLLALILLWRSASLGKEKFAPATREELQNDWQCLKLLLKGNEKS